MKITGIYLKNYIGFYCGLGIDEVKIDFTKCLHDIVMIVGDNGSGKSTLLRAMNPLPDPNSCFIPDRTARKVISYVDEIGTEFFIEYIHAVGTNGKRETTKGYIKKTINGQLVELNPNGNINSAKDILYSELGLDPNFVSLSEIGCENRGIATKRPAERKQYVNDISSTLDVYNNIYKTLSKRSSTFRGMINTINSKMDSLGDPEIIYNTLVSLNNRIDSMNKERDALIMKIAEDEATIKSIDPDGHIQELSGDINSKLQKYSSDETRATEVVENIVNKLKIDVSKVYSTHDEIRSRISEKELFIERCKFRIVDLIADKESRSKEIASKTAKLNNLKSDEHYEKIRNAYEETKDRVMKYEKMMSDMNILGVNISSAELISGIKTLLAIKDYIQTLKDRFDYSVVRMAMNNPISKNDLSSLSESIEKAEDKVTELEKNIAFYKGQLSIAEALSKRPSSCTDDTCPFVANSLKIMSMGYDEKLTSSEEELYETEVFIGRANDDLEAMVRLSDCRFILDSITDKIDSTKTILMKLPNGEIFSDSNVLISRFLDGYAFEEINTLASYIDMANVVDLYNSDTKYLSNLEKDLNEFKYKTQMIDGIIEELTELQSGFDSIISQIEALNADITNVTRELMSLKEEDKNYTLLEQSLTELDDISKNKAELTVEYNKIENDIVRIKSLLANLQLNRSRLSVLDNDLKPLVIDRDNCNHSIRTLAEYNEELKQYQSSYDTIEAIKYYSSPTSGIQIIFLNLYMNKILSLANELLSLMFNGELEILPFIINEREFRIPCCSVGGLPSDDITSMSNSQICIISMAIQFALLYHSSTKLNIPRLDEIDSGLDFSNRGQFIIFLRELMGRLRIQQTFIISHNSEIPTNNVDIIMLKNDNSIKELAGNIIYRY